MTASDPNHVPGRADEFSLRLPIPGCSVTADARDFFAIDDVEGGHFASETSLAPTAAPD